MMAERDGRDLRGRGCPRRGRTDAGACRARRAATASAVSPRRRWSRMAATTASPPGRTANAIGARHPGLRAARIRGRPRVLRPGPESPPRDHGVLVAMTASTPRAHDDLEAILSRSRSTTVRRGTRLHRRSMRRSHGTMPRVSDPRSTSSTRRPRSRSGTARLISTGRSTSIPSAPPSNSRRTIVVFNTCAR